MSNTIELDKNSVLDAHKKGTATEKKLLEKLYGKTMFQPNIIELVKSMADVYAIAKVDPKAFNLPKNATADQIATNAFLKLRLAAKILNQGWTPDWGNDNQYKYCPWFVWDKKKKGFSFHNVGCFYSVTHVGSRLCFQTSELAEHAAKTFLSEYNQLLIN